MHMMTIRNMSTLVAASLLAALAAASPAVAQEDGEGTLKWSFRTGDWISSSPAIAADGTIYAGSRDKGLYALTPEGKLKWLFEMSGFLSASPAIAADGTIYLSDNKSLFAIAPDGKRKWTFNGADIFSTPALGSDGTIYVGNRDNKVYALTP